MRAVQLASIGAVASMTAKSGRSEMPCRKQSPSSFTTSAWKSLFVVISVSEDLSIRKS
jgi:hypothetical protein